MYHLRSRTPMTSLLMIIISEQNRLTDDDIYSSITNYKQKSRGPVTPLRDRVELNHPNAITNDFIGQYQSIMLFLNYTPGVIFLMLTDLFRVELCVGH